jgi:predicted outer membrane repeat protein
LFIEDDSVISVLGTRFEANVANSNGGAIAAYGDEELKMAHQRCSAVDVVIDWRHTWTNATCVANPYLE